MYGYRVIVSIRGRREYKGSYIFVRMCGCAPLNDRLHTNPDYPHSARRGRLQQPLQHQSGSPETCAMNEDVVG